MPPGQPYFGKQGYVMRVMEAMRREPSSAPVSVTSCFGGMAFYRGYLFEITPAGLGDKKQKIPPAPPGKKCKLYLTVSSILVFKGWKPCQKHQL